MSALNYFETPIVSVGITNPKEEEGFEVLSRLDSATNVYRKIVLRNNVVVGMIFVNDIKRTGIIFFLMKNRIDASDFKQRLIDDDFGLVMLPEKLRKRMLRGSQND